MDLYTEKHLRKNLQALRVYLTCIQETSREIGVKLADPGLKDYSENIIKFILRKQGDETCVWAKGLKKKSGDLYSDYYGTLECKSFTSDGAISFSPKPHWNILYILDAKDWFEHDRFTLYKVDLNSDETCWLQGVMVNQKETYKMQSEDGRRPRIAWKKLYPQIKNYTTRIFQGTLDDIFDPSVKCEKPLDPIKPIKKEIKSPVNQEAHETLNKLTKAKLIDLCKEKNIRCKTRYTKKDLIDLLV